MMDAVKQYFIVFVVFLLVDMVWLVKISTKFYRNNIGHLMADKVNFAAAAIFYLLFVAAIVIFVVNPAFRNESVSHGFLYGALFGFITYATYDLTNNATLKDWPVIVTVVDIIWGTVLVSLTSGISVILALKLKG